MPTPTEEIFTFGTRLQDENGVLGIIIRTYLHNGRRYDVAWETGTIGTWLHKTLVDRMIFIVEL